MGDMIARALALRGEAKETFPISRGKWYSGISNGTDIDVTYRTKHEALCNCHTLRLVYGNFHTDDDPTRLTALSDYTINCTVEVSGRFYNVTFGGKKTITVQPSGKVVSDPIGVEFTKGQTFYVRQHIVVATSGKFPLGLTGLVANGEGMLAGDQTTAATYTAPTDANSFAPLALYATPNAKGFKVVACIGDSISTGAGHTNVAVEGHIPGEVGFMQIAAMRAGYGYASLGMNGQRTDGFVQYKRLNRMVLVKDCDIAICNYGTNDLANQVALQTIKDNLLDIWAALTSRGIKVYQTTITPHTTSTDAWTTTTNQTPTNASTAGGAGTDRTLLNDWIRTIPSANLVGIIEVADVVESSRNSGLWKPGYTTDGIHPNNTGHTDIANVISF